MQGSLAQSLIIFLLLMVYTNTFSQEYTYDSNGNLVSDSHKEIAYTHYNHLNLVDTIIYADGRKMIYTYTASGQKLREQSILANGTIKQKRDYTGVILYRNDSLQEIKHEDGRIIPGDEAEYQYHLSDHLGNVRTTLTSNQEVDNSTATYETENATTEQNKYLRYTVARRVNTPLFDHTHNGITFYSERLNGSANEKYGIARSLSVMPGDTIKLEVFAKYVDQNSSNWTQALTTLLTQITAGTAPMGTVVDGANYATSGATPFPFAGLNNTASSAGVGPKAYLNWLVFDRNFILKTGGYVKMTDAAKENGTNVAHERLSTEFTIKEAGYVYVYLSNEETTPKEVYFDDLSVAQVKGPIVQESDYDPFGLTFNEYSGEKAMPNNFLYNGKELQSDFELNWYDYGARMYDAALGRWHVIDPMAEKYAGWSPYNYVMNNPIKFIDPTGRDVFFAIKVPEAKDFYDTDKILHPPPHPGGDVVFIGNQSLTEGYEDMGTTTALVALDRLELNFFGEVNLSEEPVGSAALGTILTYSTDWGYGNAYYFISNYYSAEVRGSALEQLVTDPKYYVEIKSVFKSKDEVEEHANGRITIHWEGGMGPDRVKVLNSLAAKAINIQVSREIKNTLETWKGRIRRGFNCRKDNSITTKSGDLFPDSSEDVFRAFRIKSTDPPDPFMKELFSR